MGTALHETIKDTKSDIINIDVFTEFEMTDIFMFFIPERYI